MTSELVNYAEQATLIMRTGIQFLDFGLTLDLRKEPPGEFALQVSAESLARLEYDERHDRHFHPSDPQTPVRPKFSVPVEDSFKLLEGCWLPCPVLRVGPQRRFFEGPTTWSRVQVVAIDSGEDPQGHTHRATFAFDTNIFEDSEETTYLAPTRADVQTGASFRLAHRAHEVAWYTEIPWVSEWFKEVFQEQAVSRLEMHQDDVERDIREELAHHAHYLNLIAILGVRCGFPEIRIRSNTTEDVHKPIPVDMVLDVGNSRTCGILIEDHPQQQHGLKNRYELALRDLSTPHRVYTEPFESRVEFGQAMLGKEHLACKSGRNDAFIWPTIARVGPEATHLANRRRGTEGSTGLSSPKRYLWDEERYQSEWRFNNAASGQEIEPFATGAPFGNLINETGEALYSLPEDERIPVFMPHYSRSALMMFMLAEVLVQALVQINSPAQRLKQGDPEKARHLRSIILTVPPSMPKPEREIFAARMHQAMGLVWKSLGWHPEDDDPGDPLDRESAWPPFPTVHTQWDEATCAQAVYLFSEIHEHFAGHPEEFFRALRRHDTGGDRQRITVASLDIGGGTTDLVISDYRLDSGPGANVYILPEQRFRDGFKVAGDDVLLEVIQAVVVPALETALRAHGVDEPAALLSRLIGSESVPMQQGALRQQLALQILYPIGLQILKRYETYDPISGTGAETPRIGELLAGLDPPTEQVRHYFANGVRELADAEEAFEILDVAVPIDLNQLHRGFLEDGFEICKSLQALCEIVHLYNCDVLLVSGRPSRLPGVQSLLRALLPLPPDRIVPLNGYRSGTWYPFHKGGRIHDPKSTAAVGAMICKVGGERKIPNFNLRASAFKAYSTVRFIGMMDQNRIVRDADVYYRNIDLDADDDLPDAPFEMRARMVLGYRQLDSERWAASPLYVLDLSDEGKSKLARAETQGEPVVLQVTLKKQRGKVSERFEIASATSEQGVTLNPRRDLNLRLCTLTTVGMGENSYWLDTGSIVS